MTLQHIVLFSFLAGITERSCTPLAFDYHLDATTVLGSEPVPSPKESS